MGERTLRLLTGAYTTWISPPNLKHKFEVSVVLHMSCPMIKTEMLHGRNKPYDIDTIRPISVSKYRMASTYSKLAYSSMSPLVAPYDKHGKISTNATLEICSTQ